MLAIVHIDAVPVRPVARVGKSGLAGTIRRSGPRRPEEEPREGVAVLRARERVGGHRVFLAQAVERDRIAEEIVEVHAHLGDRRRALRRHRDGVRSGVIRVAAKLVLHDRLDRSLLRERKRRVRNAVHRLGAEAAVRSRFAMQPVRGPVRRDVASMAPHGAELLAAGGEPRALAFLDLRRREDRLSRSRLHVGNRRRGHIDLAPDPSERGERKHEDDSESLPQLAGWFHVFSLLIDVQRMHLLRGAFDARQTTRRPPRFY